MGKTELQAAEAGEFYSRDGYLVKFISDRWELSKDIIIPIGASAPYLQELDYSFRRVLEFYARTNAPSHTKGGCRS